ncbi:hypothetical protein GPECTOR_51g694 [Gonium pectorale]|uniref:Uncharacterized protein n=1 Tax=Gonium pectorale TaxID=33097 RepID=A0A150G7A0_GONPE|nr:hypothetical protein GPECTOR_51g694 [Gonium pectorale]|eukprot:KXZ45708.1 hypothetical protein GPECTOR_51g694 [Gonium pectorale]
MHTYLLRVGLYDKALAELAAAAAARASATAKRRRASALLTTANAAALAAALAAGEAAMMASGGANAAAMRMPQADDVARIATSSSAAAAANGDREPAALAQPSLHHVVPAPSTPPAAQSPAAATATTTAAAAASLAAGASESAVAAHFGSLLVAAGGSSGGSGAGGMTHGSQPRNVLASAEQAIADTDTLKYASWRYHHANTGLDIASSGGTNTIYENPLGHLGSNHGMIVDGMLDSLELSPSAASAASRNLGAAIAAMHATNYAGGAGGPTQHASRGALTAAAALHSAAAAAAGGGGGGGAAMTTATTTAATAAVTSPAMSTRPSLEASALGSSLHWGNGRGTVSRTASGMSAVGGVSGISGFASANMSNGVVATAISNGTETPRLGGSAAPSATVVTVASLPSAGGGTAGSSDQVELSLRQAPAACAWERPEWRELEERPSAESGGGKRAALHSPSSGLPSPSPSPGRGQQWAAAEQLRRSHARTSEELSAASTSAGLAAAAAAGVAAGGSRASAADDEAERIATISAAAASSASRDSATAATTAPASGPDGLTGQLIGWSLLVGAMDGGELQTRGSDAAATETLGSWIPGSQGPPRLDRSRFVLDEQRSDLDQCTPHPSPVGVTRVLAVACGSSGGGIGGGGAQGEVAVAAEALAAAIDDALHGLSGGGAADGREAATTVSRRATVPPASAAGSPHDGGAPTAPLRETQSSSPPTSLLLLGGGSSGGSRQTHGSAAYAASSGSLANGRGESVASPGSAAHPPPTANPHASRLYRTASQGGAGSHRMSHDRAAGTVGVYRGIAPTRTNATGRASVGSAFDAAARDLADSATLREAWAKVLTDKGPSSGTVAVAAAVGSVAAAARPSVAAGAAAGPQLTRSATLVSRGGYGGLYSNAAAAAAAAVAAAGARRRAVTGTGFTGGEAPGLGWGRDVTAAAARLPAAEEDEFGLLSAAGSATQRRTPWLAGPSSPAAASDASTSSVLLRPMQQQQHSSFHSNSFRNQAPRPTDVLYASGDYDDHGSVGGSGLLGLQAPALSRSTSAYPPSDAAPTPAGLTPANSHSAQVHLGSPSLSGGGASAAAALNTGGHDSGGGGASGVPSPHTEIRAGAIDGAISPPLSGLPGYEHLDEYSRKHSREWIGSGGGATHGSDGRFNHHHLHLHQQQHLHQGPSGSPQNSGSINSPLRRGSMEVSAYAHPYTWQRSRPAAPAAGGGGAGGRPVQAAAAAIAAGPQGPVDGASSQQWFRRHSIDAYAPQRTTVPPVGPTATGGAGGLSSGMRPGHVCPEQQRMLRHVGGGVLPRLAAVQEQMPGLQGPGPFGSPVSHLVASSVAAGSTDGANGGGGGLDIARMLARASELVTTDPLAAPAASAAVVATASDTAPPNLESPMLPGPPAGFAAAAGHSRTPSTPTSPTSPQPQQHPRRSVDARQGSSRGGGALAKPPPGSPPAPVGTAPGDLSAHLGPSGGIEPYLQSPSGPVSPTSPPHGAHGPGGPGATGPHALSGHALTHPHVQGPGNAHGFAGAAHQAPSRQPSHPLLAGTRLAPVDECGGSSTAVTMDDDSSGAHSGGASGRSGGSPLVAAAAAAPEVTTEVAAWLPETAATDGGASGGAAPVVSLPYRADASAHSTGAVGGDADAAVARQGDGVAAGAEGPAAASTLKGKVSLGKKSLRFFSKIKKAFSPRDPGRDR